MLADQSIDTYLQRLAGKSSTPGGGAAAGIAGAQAAALLGMVAQYSKDESLSLPTIIAMCETSSRHFLALADQDIAGFNQVMAAYGLPANDSAAKQRKQVALQQALETAALAPTEMLKACLALLSTAKFDHRCRHRRKFTPLLHPIFSPESVGQFEGDYKSNLQR